MTAPSAHRLSAYRPLRRLSNQSMMLKIIQLIKAMKPTPSQKLPNRMTTKAMIAIKIENKVSI